MDRTAVPSASLQLANGRVHPAAQIDADFARLVEMLVAAVLAAVHPAHTT